jgi:hypothetical protein
MRWVVASSFLYSSIDIGVVTGCRKQPLASCTQRAVEPLLRIPKSAVITWFRLAGREDTLAVVDRRTRCRHARCCCHAGPE